MPPDAAPEVFSWLTTEKAAGLIAIIAAAGAYYFGGRKREKLDAAPGPVNMTQTNDLLVELLGVFRSYSRQSSDRAEVDHAVHVQIRDEIRALRAGKKVKLMGDTIEQPLRQPGLPAETEE